MVCIAQVTGYRDGGAAGTYVDFALTWVPHNATDRYNSPSADYHPDALAAAQYFYQMLTQPDDPNAGWSYWEARMGRSAQLAAYGTQTVLPPAPLYQVSSRH